MMKKAKLDILEIAPEEPGGDAPPGEAAAEKAEENGSPGEQTGGDFRSMVIRWVRRPLFWLILISVTLLGLTAGILISFYQNTEGHAPPVAQQKMDVPAASRPAAKPGILCEGMVVDQKDEKGNMRIVFCDVALVLENQRTASASDGDRSDVRNAIYDVLKKEPAQEGLSPAGRGRMKEKIKNGLKGLFAGNPVKEIYFTRYELD